MKQITMDFLNDMYIYTYDISILIVVTKESNVLTIP